MSLINDALRKAQQDRTPKRMSDHDGPSQPQGAFPVQSSGIPFGLIFGLIAAVALLVGLVAGLSIVLLQKDGANQTVGNRTVMAEPVVDEPVVPATKTITPSEPIQAMNAPKAQSSGGQENILETLRKAREEAEAKAATEAAAAAEAQRIANMPPNEKIIEWLSQAKVTGVRMSTEGNSKAIINNDAYSVGELVHYSMGLKLIVIQETRLLFEDANGKRYMKRL